MIKLFFKNNLPAIRPLFTLAGLKTIIQLAMGVVVSVFLITQIIPDMVRIHF